MSFMETEEKCEICGTVMAVHGCLRYEGDEAGDLCKSCEKAVKDAQDQRNYLRVQNGND